MKYNCHKKNRQSLFVKSHHIVSIAVGNSVIVVLEEKLSGNRTVVQIANEDYDGK